MSFTQSNIIISVFFVNFQSLENIIIMIYNWYAKLKYSNLLLYYYYYYWGYKSVCSKEGIFNFILKFYHLIVEQLLIGVCINFTFTITLPLLLLYLTLPYLTLPYRTFTIFFTITLFYLYYNFNINLVITLWAVLKPMNFMQLSYNFLNCMNVFSILSGILLLLLWYLVFRPFLEVLIFLFPRNIIAKILFAQGFLLE